MRNAHQLVELMNVRKEAGWTTIALVVLRGERGQIFNRHDEVRLARLLARGGVPVGLLKVAAGPLTTIECEPLDEHREFKKLQALGFGSIDDLLRKMSDCWMQSMGAKGPGRPEADIPLN